MRGRIGEKLLLTLSEAPSTVLMCRIWFFVVVVGGVTVLSGFS